MSIDTIPTAEADLQAVNDAVLAGRPIPCDVAQRVEERAADFRRRMAQRGVRNFGTSIIREARENRH